MMASSRYSATVTVRTLENLLPFLVLPAGVAAIEVSGLTLDSRCVEPGDLFVALPGLKTNGAEYIDQAIKAGAVAVLAERESECAELVSDVNPDKAPVLAIEQLREQLSNIAAAFYGYPANDFDIYGVTGTNGKTTCCYLLGQLLAGLGQKSGVIGTLGFGVLECVAGAAVAPFTSGLTETGFTTPDAIALQAIFKQLQRDQVTATVMEVSSHSLVQHRLAAVPVKVALFTNLSQDHLDYHGTMDAYGQAKAQLFSLGSVEHCIINTDDAFGASLIAKLKQDGKHCLSYSLDNKSADIFAHSIQVSSSGTQVVVDTPWGAGMFHTALIGRFNISNLLAVIAAACVGTRASLAEVLAGVANLAPIPGRMQTVQVAERLVVVDYAHTPDALEKTLQTLRPYVAGKLYCVFGCGGDRDVGKRPQMGAIAERLADVVYVTSDNPRTESPARIIADILAGTRSSAAVQVEEDRARAIRSAIYASGPGDAVLIAGKGHEAYQIIGEQTLPFSDMEIAQQVLAELGGAYD